MNSGVADADDIATLGFMPHVSQAVHKVYGTILIRRQHADPLHADGQQDEMEKNDADEDEDDDTNRRDLRISSHRDYAEPVRPWVWSARYRVFRHPR